MKTNYSPILIAAVMVAAFFASGCSKAPAATADTRPVFQAMVMVGGKSMLPTFSEGEIVSLELCPFSALRARDTVIYWHDGAKLFVHHRLDSRDATGLWVTRGDNNPGVDTGHMTADEFVGRTHRFGQ